MSYDDKCRDLAEYILEFEIGVNTTRHRTELTQAIQDAIESYLESARVAVEQFEWFEGQDLADRWG